MTQGSYRFDKVVKFTVNWKFVNLGLGYGKWWKKNTRVEKFLTHSVYDLNTVREETC